MKKTMAIAVLVMTAWTCYPQSQGKINFMRQGFAGSYTSMKVFIDEKLVCKVNIGCFSIHEVSAGEHKVAVQASGKQLDHRVKELTIKVEPGKTNYIEIAVAGLMVSCIEVTENTAAVALEKMKPDKTCF